MGLKKNRGAYKRKVGDGGASGLETAKTNVIWVGFRAEETEMTLNRNCG